MRRPRCRRSRATRRAARRVAAAAARGSAPGGRKRDSPPGGRRGKAGTAGASLRRTDSGPRSPSAIPSPRRTAKTTGPAGIRSATAPSGAGSVITARDARTRQPRTRAAAPPRAPERDRREKVEQAPEIARRNAAAVSRARDEIELRQVIEPAYPGLGDQLVESRADGRRGSSVATSAASRFGIERSSRAPLGGRNRATAIGANTHGDQVEAGEILREQGAAREHREGRPRLPGAGLGSGSTRSR